jgi:hypothetical protein
VAKDAIGEREREREMTNREWIMGRFDVQQSLIEEKLNFWFEYAEIMNAATDQGIECCPIWIGRLIPFPFFLFQFNSMKSRSGYLRCETRFRNFMFGNQSKCEIMSHQICLWDHNEIFQYEWKHLTQWMNQFWSVYERNHQTIDSHGNYLIWFIHPSTDGENDLKVRIEKELIGD